MIPSVSSAQLLIDDAQRRGITCTSFADIRPGFALLEYQGHQEYIFQSQSNLTGRVTARLFNDNKVLATHLLRRHDFPVPHDGIITTVAEGEVFLRQYQRVVIKPIGSDGGKGVTPGITTREQLAEAIEIALPYNSKGTMQLVCQEHIVGRDWRILVVDQQHLFASERIPAHVTGDGHSTIQQLLTDNNKTVRPGYDIRVTPQTPALLAEQGYTLESVVPSGVVVHLARVANAHAGGTVRDATDEIGEATRRFALRLAKVFACPLVGIDVLSDDISQDPGNIIELNPCPDLTIHHFPTLGQARTVAPLIIDMLFPETIS